MPRFFNPHSTGFLVLLSLCSGLPALGTDMALSGTSAIADAFQVPVSDVGLALSAFMIGFAGSPLLYGPLADRFGRKPVILVASAIFTLASIGCALASTLPELLAWRLAQGIGAGASRSLPTSIVRDLFDGAVARAKMSYIGLMGLLAPICAPTIGSGLLLLSSWRGIYGFLALMGGAVFVAMLFGYGESFTPTAQNNLRPGQIAANYAETFRHRQSLRYTLVATLSFGCLFSYVSGSPFVLMEAYELGPTAYGLTFAFTTVALLAGNFVNGKLNARAVSPRIPLAIGLGLAAATSTALAVLSMTVHISLPLLLGLVALCMFSAGLIFANAIQLALQPLPHIAGVASAALAACQLGLGAIAGAAVAYFFDGRTPLSTAAAMAICAWLSLAVYRLLPAEASQGEAAAVIATE